jgi:hypothetical protein
MPYLQYVDWLFLKIWAFTGTTDTRSNIAAPTGSIGAIEFGGIFGAYIFRGWLVVVELLKVSID